MAAVSPWAWLWGKSCGYREARLARAAHEKARDYYLMCEDTATALRRPQEERAELRATCIQEFGVDPLAGERVNRG